MSEDTFKLYQMPPKTEEQAAMEREVELVYRGAVQIAVGAMQVKEGERETQIDLINTPLCARMAAQLYADVLSEMGYEAHRGIISRMTK